MKDKFPRLRSITPAFNASLASQISIATGLLSSVLVIPLIIRKYSSSDLTCWLYLNLILSFSSIADLGFGSALVRKISYLIHDRKEGHADDNEIKSAIGSFQIIYVGLSLLAMVCSYLVGGLRDVDSIAGVDPISRQLSVVFAAISTGLLLYLNFISNVAQAFDKLALAKVAEIVFNLLRLVLIALFAFGKVRIELLFLIQLVCHIGLLFSQLKFIKAVVGKHHVSLAFPVWSSKIVSEVWPATWRQGAITIGGVAINNAAALTLTHISDSRQANAYLLISRYISVVRSISQAPVVSSASRYLKLRAKGEIEKLASNFSENVAKALVFHLIGNVLVGVSLFYLSYYNENKVSFNLSIFMAVSVISILEMHHSSHAFLYITKNQVPFLLSSFLSGAAIVSFNLLFSSGGWLWMPIIVQGLVQLAYNNWWPVKINLADLDVKVSSYLKTIVRETFEILCRPMSLLK